MPAMRLWRLPRSVVGLVAGLVLAAGPALGSGQEAVEEPASPSAWALEVWSPPFDFRSPTETITYRPLERASQKWRICASYPHLKDSYWLSVNYGMVEEAKRLGVALRVVEAGGYPNLERQIAQITECAQDADILALGAVSFDGLTEAVLAISEEIPVIAVVNDIADPGISAKAAVSWVTMGEVPGAYLASLHPAGTPPVKVAWFPGPRESQWAHFVEEGFTEALAGSAVDIVVRKWGDTGREIQLILVEEALEERPDVDYIVGSAVTAGAAVSLLRARGLTGQIQVLANYFTHAVYRGIKREKILAAPTDFPALQGRMGIEMAVRLLEGKLEYPHAGPLIHIVEQANLDSFSPRLSLAPADFSPTFVVE